MLRPGIRIAVSVLALALATGAWAADVYFLVRVGSDAEGNPMFRPADGRDGWLSGLYELSTSSRPIRETARYYESVQVEKLYTALRGRGMSSQELSFVASNYRPDPVFIEVTGQGGGAFNDWKGRFSVDWGGGQTASYSTPRVVFPINGDVMRSGNRGLIEQTIVHEVAHGVMAKAYGTASLPQTANLTRPHSGGTVVDEQLAIIEGYAEFIGAYFTGRLTIAEDPHGALDSNHYALHPDGRLKSLGELHRTEGWVATVLYHIAAQGKDRDALAKITRVMQSYRPQNLNELLAYLRRDHPELAQTVDTVVYRDSGGQQGMQYAGGHQGGGQYGDRGGSQYDPFSRIQSLVSGGYGPGQRSGAIYQEYQRARQHQEQLMARPPTDLDGMFQVGAGAQALYGAYEMVQRRLARTSQWQYWDRQQLQAESAMILDLYYRQLEVEERTLMAAGPQGHASGTYAAGASAPRQPKDSYRQLVDTLKQGTSDAARKVLETYRGAREALFKKRGQAGSHDDSH